MNKSRFFFAFHEEKKIKFMAKNFQYEYFEISNKSMPIKLSA